MRIDKKTLQWAAWLWAPPPVGSDGLRAAHEFRGVPVDPAKEIARLRGRLRNVPEDGILLNKIAGLQFDMGEYEQTKKTNAIAKAYLEMLLKRDSDNMTWKVEYASTLAVDGDFDRADRLILAIARINPSDWQIWRSLGDYALRRAVFLLGFAIGTDGLEAAWLRFQNRALANPSLEQTADLAERWLQFAGSAYAKAVQLAPTEPDVWLSQVAFLLREVSIRNQIRAARRQPINATAKSDNADFRKEIEAILAKIERIGQTEDGKIAGRCHLNAAVCCWLLDRPAATAAHAHKAVELIPEDEVAWNTLAGHLLNELEFKELLTVLTEKAKRFPTPANRLYAAGAYWRFFEDLDAAEQHLCGGLKLVENDLFCTMGMAAIALHRGDSPAHLAEAERWLQKADAILGEQKNAHHLLLTGILRGLQGDALASQAYLREAQALDPGNANIKTALQAVSP
jgi:tetratricopeptide (TPR) repeat protein